MGYKVALCQRDIAIQSSLLIFTLIFALARQKSNLSRFLFGLFSVSYRLR